MFTWYVDGLSVTSSLTAILIDTNISLSHMLVLLIMQHFYISSLFCGSLKIGCKSKVEAIYLNDQQPSFNFDAKNSK